MSNSDGSAMCAGCSGNEPTRRRVLTGASLVGVGLVSRVAIRSASAEPADERPKEGDQLVAIDASAPMPLAPGDINGPLLAWPMEPATSLVRSDSRLNKIVLVRLDPASLTGVTRERATEGVVAYSAICPHAGCEVNGWVAEQGLLECPCHNSRYDPREAAMIVDGPTTRPLAALPLGIAEGKLVVAKPFIGRLGIAPA